MKTKPSQTAPGHPVSAASDGLGRDSRRVSGRIAGALSAVVLLFALVATVPPAHNWDLIAYVALANSWVNEDLSPAQMHGRTWSQLRTSVPAVQYRRLRGDGGVGVAGSGAATWAFTDDVISYRSAVASDPNALAAQLPFYAVKPLYPALIAGFLAVDVDPVIASVWITKVCWIIFGWVLFGLLRSVVAPVPSLIALGVLMSLPMVRALGSYSTPDALCSMLLLAAVSFALRPAERRQQLPALGCCVLAIVARPDSILLIGPVALWLIAREPMRWRKPLVAVVIGVVCCGLQSYFSENQGWAVLFHHSFISYLHFPDSAPIDLQLAEVVSIYFAQVHQTRQFWGFVGLAGVIALARMRGLGGRDNWFCGLLVIIVFMLSHWVLFPDQKDRMMVASYLFIFVAAVQLVVDWIATNAQGTRPSKWVALRRIVLNNTSDDAVERFLNRKGQQTRERLSDKSPP